MRTTINHRSIAYAAEATRASSIKTSPAAQNLTHCSSARRFRVSIRVGWQVVREPGGAPAGALPSSDASEKPCAGAEEVVLSPLAEPALQDVLGVDVLSNK